MIYLHEITKHYRPKHAMQKLVFRPTTIALPTDRRLAILGDRLEGKSLLLRLLAGEEAPDTGAVVQSVRVSPVANAKLICNQRLSGLENIRLIARMHGVDPERTAWAIEAFCGLGDDLAKPLKVLTAPQRRLLELSLLAVLSYDCYLFDTIHSVPADLSKGFFDTVIARGAGLIFAAQASRWVRELADCAVVIRNSTLHPFNHVEEAIEFYERRAS